MWARWAQDGAGAASRRQSWAEPRAGPARDFSRDARTWRSTREDTFPTVLPVLLELVGGPERLPADAQGQEKLRARLRILQAGGGQVEALFTELSARLVSISSEDGAVLVSFRSCEELWRFSTYHAAGLLAHCLEELLLEPELLLASLEEEVALVVRVQEEALDLLHRGLLTQEGSLFGRCSSSQMLDGGTSGGALYLEQGQLAHVLPPGRGPAWSVRRLADGARGTGPRPVLEPLEPFHQWVLRSDGESTWMGGGAPVDFPLQFASGACVVAVEHQAQGPHELSVAPGERITILGRLASCFHWFTGRRESTGDVGLVRTAAVGPSWEVFSSTEVFLEGEDPTFFCLHEDTVVKETTFLLKKKSQHDFGHSYKLDTIPDADFEVSAVCSSAESMWSGVGGHRTVDQVASAPALPPQEPQRSDLACFRVHPVAEGNFTALFSFLEGASYRPELAALYTLSSRALASSVFTGHAGEDELISFLSVARETARKQRLLWPQTRLCYLLGKLCAARLKLSQARVYLEETLSVPREGFADLKLLASIFSGLVGIHHLQKNAEASFASAERLAGLLFGSPDCVEGLADDVALKYVLKKAVLCGNRMAEARACHLLARFHWVRAEADRAVPYLERLLVLCTAAEMAPPTWISHASLALGRLYGQLRLPRLSLGSARKVASLHSRAAPATCLSAATLVLELTKEEDVIPAQLAPYLHRALAFTGVQTEQHQVLRHHLTMCLCRLFCKHGMVERAIRQMHRLLDSSDPCRHTALSAAERNSALLWLAWLHLERRQPQAALDILDAVLDSMPEGRATPQAGAVLNMRGVALGCTRDLRRAAESYQAAADICEEQGDTANWAVAQANRGLLCLKAGAPRLAQRQLARAVGLFSQLDHQHHQENLIAVLLQLGRSYLQQRQLDYGRGCYEWALLLSISTGLLERQLTATQHLCQLYERECPDQGRCIRYHQHQVQLLRARGAPGQEAESMEALSQRYLSLGTQRAYRAALDGTKSSLALFIDLGWKEKEASGWLQAGRIYHLLGQTELVDLYVQAAQDAALSTGDSEVVLKILEAAGDLFFNSSQDRHKAIPFYRDRALPVSRRSGSSAAARLRLCNKLAELMLRLKSYAEAVEFAQAALDISVSQGNRLNERVAYHRLATLYHHLDQYELAEHYYLKAVSLCPAPLLFEEETLYYEQVYHTLGDITFHHLKDPFDAAGYYHLALAAAMDLGNKRSQLQLCTRLATINHNFLLDRELSLFFYQKARRFATELNVRRANISADQYRRPLREDPQDD